MSFGDSPPPPLPLELRGAPPPPRSGCLTALMVLVGIILLLPGLCALIFGGVALSQSQVDSGYMPFIVIGLLVGFGGVMLIRAAIRGPRR